MNLLNVDVINRISISNVQQRCFAFRPLWLIATNGNNTDTLNCRNHNHAFYELHVITRGSLSYGFGDCKLTLNENEFTIIPPNLRHKVVEHTNDIEKFTVAFEFDNSLNICNLSEDLLKCKLGFTPDIKTDFDKIIKLCVSKKQNKSEQIYLTICNLLFEISNLSCKPVINYTVQNNCDDRVFKAKKYIEDNYDIFFTCSEVASYCRISEKQLGRLFLKYENISLLSYIHNKKIDSIKKMLINKSMTHKEVSENLGFSSIQYYGKFIQRMTGMTPEIFRKSLIKS